MSDSFIPVPWAAQRDGDATAGASREVGHDKPSQWTRSEGRGSYLAYRIGSTLFILARGDVPNLQTQADLQQLPLRIHPPKFGLFFYTPNGIVIPTLKAFTVVEQFGYPIDEAHVTIHDADGEHVVEINESISKQAGDIFGIQADRAKPVRTGYGKTVQEAIDQAVLQLPSGNPQIADGFVTYNVVKLGRFKGGIAGIDRHFATVEAVFNTTTP